MRLCFGLFQDREGRDWKRRRNEPSRSHGRVFLLWGRICVSKNKWSIVVVAITTDFNYTSGIHESGAR